MHKAASTASAIKRLVKRGKVSKALEKLMGNSFAAQDFERGEPKNIGVKH